MTKLIRTRQIDNNKQLPIIIKDNNDVSDLVEYSNLNRGAPQLLSTMDKGEESELHFYRVLQDLQNKKSENIKIPIPEVFDIKSDYESTYSNDFVLPKNYITDKNLNLFDENNIAQYDMTEEDEFWLKRSGLNMPRERFENIIAYLDKSTRHQAIKLEEAVATLRNEPQHWVIAVYDYWLQTRIKKKMPFVMRIKSEKIDTKSNNNTVDPYVAFRRRSEKMTTRRNRKVDEISYEKMYRLCLQMEQAKKLVNMVSQREQTKAQIIDVSWKIFLKRLKLSNQNLGFVKDSVQESADSSKSANSADPVSLEEIGSKSRISKGNNRLSPFLPFTEVQSAAETADHLIEDATRCDVRSASNAAAEFHHMLNGYSQLPNVASADYYHLDLSVNAHDGGFGGTEERNNISYLHSGELPQFNSNNNLFNRAAGCEYLPFRLPSSHSLNSHKSSSFAISSLKSVSTSKLQYNHKSFSSSPKAATVSKLNRLVRFRKGRCGRLLIDQMNEDNDQLNPNATNDSVNSDFKKLYYPAESVIQSNVSTTINKNINFVTPKYSNQSTDYKKSSIKLLNTTSVSKIPDSNTLRFRYINSGLKQLQFHPTEITSTPLSQKNASCSSVELLRNSPSIFDIDLKSNQFSQFPSSTSSESPTSSLTSTFMSSSNNVIQNSSQKKVDVENHIIDCKRQKLYQNHVQSESFNDQNQSDRDKSLSKNSEHENEISQIKSVSMKSNQFQPLITDSPDGNNSIKKETNSRSPSSPALSTGAISKDSNESSCNFESSLTGAIFQNHSILSELIPMNKSTKAVNDHQKLSTYDEYKLNSHGNEKEDVIKNNFRKRRRISNYIPENSIRLPVSVESPSKGAQSESISSFKIGLNNNHSKKSNNSSNSLKTSAILDSGPTHLIYPKMTPSSNLSNLSNSANQKFHLQRLAHSRYWTPEINSVVVLKVDCDEKS